MSLKDIFLNELKQIAGDTIEVGVALSSGMDSTAVVLGLLELGKKVTAYCFHIEGIESQDFNHAKNNCSIFNVPFIDCRIPKEIDEKLVLHIINKYRKYKKVDIECIYPFYSLLPLVKEKILITGACADGHFCVSKKGMIHYRSTIEKLHQFRTGLFTNPDYAQTKTLGKIGLEEFGIKIDTPFNKKSIVDFFFDKTWNEINKPHQKQPILDMFPEEFTKIKIFNHTNLQCGDSQIRELFEPLLLRKHLNTKKRKRVKDLYLDLYNLTNTGRLDEYL